MVREQEVQDEAFPKNRALVSHTTGEIRPSPDLSMSLLFSSPPLASATKRLDVGTLNDELCIGYVAQVSFGLMP